MNEWKKAYNKPAFPTLEEWIVTQARGGEKFESVMFICGSHMRATIRWNDGSGVELLVGEREPGQVCVLAQRAIEDLEANAP